MSENTKSDDIRDMFEDFPDDKCPLCGTDHSDPDDQWRCLENGRENSTREGWWLDINDDNPD